MKRIYLYLFIFSLVINVFQYVNDSNVLKHQQERIETLEKKLKQSQDSLNALKNQPEIKTNL